MFQHLNQIVVDKFYTLYASDGGVKRWQGRRVLGITLANADVLRRALLDAAANSDRVEPRGNNGFGEVYVLRFALATTKGTATVLSAWIIRYGEDFPRLITCHPV